MDERLPVKCKSGDGVSVEVNRTINLDSNPCIVDRIRVEVDRVHVDYTALHTYLRLSHAALIFSPTSP